MSKFWNFLTGSGSKLVDSIGDAIDKNSTSKEEIASLVAAYEVNAQSELTERHKTDMQSDNKLSKNIRPLLLIYTTLVISVLALTDGNIGEFQIKEAYITLFESVWTLQIIWHFGGRSLEKAGGSIRNMLRKKKE